MPVATVEVKSAWFAKINWTQAVGMVSIALTLVTGNKYSIPADVQLSIVSAIAGAQAVVTWVLRTWFNGTVPPAAVK